MDKIERISKALLVPLVGVCLAAWFHYRIDQQKLRMDAGYGVVTPAVVELQAHVTALDTQMQVLQKLVLAQSVKPTPSVPAATITTNAAIESFKKDLVVKVQKSQGHALLVRALPPRLDDVLASPQPKGATP